MLIFLASFMLVFLKAIQQQNVVHGKYAMAAITSYGLALSEVAVILYAVKIGWDAVPYMGTGGAIGGTLAMYVHRKYIHNRNNTND